MDGVQQIQIVSPITKINLKEFAAKFKTKGEIFKFLVVEAKVYLPEYQCVTIWHMQDLAAGEKTPIYGDEVKHITVPFYDNLTLELILDFGLAYKEVVDCFPVMREIRKMPRWYICNVIYSKVGDPFDEWVKNNCNDRNERFTQKHGLEIKLQARIAAAFEASTAVNQSNGTGAHLMKIGSKRRRTKQQIEDDKNVALSKQQAIEEKLVLIENLQRENAKLQAKSQAPSEGDEAIAKLLELGMLQRDQNGVINIPNYAPDESGN